MDHISVEFTYAAETCYGELRTLNIKLLNVLKLLLEFADYQLFDPSPVEQGQCSHVPLQPQICVALNPSESCASLTQFKIT